MASFERVDKIIVIVVTLEVPNIFFPVLTELDGKSEPNGVNVDQIKIYLLIEALKTVLVVVI